MMIDVFQSLDVIYLVAKAQGIIVSVKIKSVQNWRQRNSSFELKSSAEIQELTELLCYIHSFICDQFFCTLDTQIFKFWLLKLKLHDILTFRWESDTSGVLSLYSPQICLNPIQDRPGTTKVAILLVFTLQLLKTQELPSKNF